MNLSLNGLSTPSKLITFNHIPTIVTISNNETKGRKDILELYIYQFSSDIVSDANNKTLQIWGYKINFTNDETKAVGTTAWLTTKTTLASKRRMAYSIISAFKNTGLSMSVDITSTMEFVTYNGKSNCIKIVFTPKKWGTLSVNGISTSSVGSMFEGFMYNLTEATYGGWSSSDNQTYPNNTDDTLVGGKVILNIYGTNDGSKQSQIGDTIQTSSFPLLSTLEKHYFNGSVSFDISPLLSNYTENGEVLEFNIEAIYLNNEQYNVIGSINSNYAVNGYSVNLGSPFLQPARNGATLAQNVNRGTKEDGVLNGTILYFIPNAKQYVSIYASRLNVNYQITVIEYNSAMNMIDKKTYNYYPASTLTDWEFTITNKNAYYVDININSMGTLRYTNIIPQNYNNDKEREVIYFRNSYGGISSFPFTAGREEEREVEKDTYKSSSLNFYNKYTKEISLKHIYRNEKKYTITLKSHYIKKDGLYTIYDMQDSFEAWILKNGIKYDIIINEVTLEEVQNGIYQVSLEYTYSSNDEF